MTGPNREPDRSVVVGEGTGDHIVRGRERRGHRDREQCENIHESRLELARLLLADHDRLLRVAAQPFVLEGVDGGRVRRHVPDRLRWAMNHCLAKIGIEHAEHRARAIGERLGVLKDYPTPPNCASLFAPVWITEMVRRQHDK